MSSILTTRVRDAMPEQVQELLGRLVRWRDRPQCARVAAVSAEFERLSGTERRAWILARVQRVLERAHASNAFLREHYGRCGFTPAQVLTFRDIERIPPVSKAQLRAAGAQWTCAGSGGVHVNTGGSSGEPLSFCVPRGFSAREKGYITLVQRRAGARPRALSFVFSGVRMGDRRLRYGPSVGGYFVNGYTDLSESLPEIGRIAQRRRVEILRGYPTLIYQFARACEADTRLLQRFRNTLRFIFLHSENPCALYRNKIEAVFEVPTLAWYGHGEMAAFAVEGDEKGVYLPDHTYGYCQAYARSDGTTSIVATSYENLLSPFIRYDTGDLIEVVKEDDGLLLAFRIKEGREGEFIYDRRNAPISLTGLIFGRHHALFARAGFVQISQSEPGFATVHVASEEENLDGEAMAALFDQKDVDIKFRFKRRPRPWRAASGKVLLLIPEDTE